MRQLARAAVGVWLGLTRYSRDWAAPHGVEPSGTGYQLWSIAIGERGARMSTSQFVGRNGLSSWSEVHLICDAHLNRRPATEVGHPFLMDHPVFSMILDPPSEMGSPPDGPYPLFDGWGTTASCVTDGDGRFRSYTESLGDEPVLSYEILEWTPLTDDGPVVDVCSKQMVVDPYGLG